MNRELGMCSVHKRRRAPHDLVDLGNGVFRCAPGNECREVELEICSIHQRRRAKHDLMETSPGVYQCTAARPCHDRFDGHRGGRGGGDRGRGRGGGGGGEGRGRGAYAPTTFAAAASSTGPARIRQRDGTMVMLSGAGAGGAGAGGSGFAASAVTMADSSSSAAAHGSGGDGGADLTNSASGGAGANLPSSAQIMAQFVANQQLQQHYMMQQAAAAAAAAGSTEGGGGGSSGAVTDYASQLAAYVGSAEVWCSRHGRRLQLRTTRSLDGGMTFMCMDPTECLAAPLEDPRILALKGCTDLLCAKHKRVRAPNWLVVEPTQGKGFVCKKPHLCRQVDGEAASLDD